MANQVTDPQIEDLKLVCPQLEDGQIADFKQAFSQFNTNGDGIATIEELDGVMRSLGQNSEPQELQGEPLKLPYFD